MATRFQFNRQILNTSQTDRERATPWQFQTNRPYGNYFTFPQVGPNIPNIDQNPVVENPRTLNQSTSYQSVLGPTFTGVYDATWKSQWDALKSAATYTTPAGLETYGFAASATQTGTLYTNKNIKKSTGGLTNQIVRSALTLAGFPSATSFTNQIFDSLDGVSTYSTTPISSKNNKYLGTPLPYLDFRARKTTVARFLSQTTSYLLGPTINAIVQGATGNKIQFEKPTEKIDLSNLIDRRYDGASAALRGSGIAAAIALSNTTTGPYTLFNLDTLYGFGQQDDTFAIRNDYTLRSSLAKASSTAGGIYRKALTLTESVIPFRGDRVNVIDYKRRTWNTIYQWQETDIDLKSKKLNDLRTWVAGAADKLGLNAYGSTKDLIRFFFTGPNLFEGGDSNSTDWALVFRAILTSFTDQFSPSWSQLNMIGRGDPNYQYGGFSRDVDLGFAVYASDRDELRIIYRKLNYLATLTTPEYKRSSKSLVAPWLRVTVGDLLVSQAAVINSLSYTFVDADTTWEINYENDPEMMQVPHKVDVSLGLHLIGNQLPERDGSLYSLSKKFNANGVPISKDPGTGWLYDSKTVKRANKGLGVFIAEDSVTERTVEK
jgi:hypothetical protein